MVAVDVLREAGGEARIFGRTGDCFRQASGRAFFADLADRQLDLGDGADRLTSGGILPENDPVRIHIRVAVLERVFVVELVDA